MGRVSGVLTSGSPAGAGGHSAWLGSAWCSSTSQPHCTLPSWCHGCGPGENDVVCYCAGGDFGLMVEAARFRSSGHRPKKVQGLSKPLHSATWTYINGSSGEETEELPCRGATYLFCHLPGDHSRRKGVPEGHPQWPLVPELPLPKAIASPLPHQCGPVSGPMEKQRKPTVSHRAVEKKRVPCPQPHTI